MTNIIILALLVLLVALFVVAIWLIDKRTRRWFMEARDDVQRGTDAAFGRVESRLIRGAGEFENTSGLHRAWAVMFTYNRKELALRTLTTLRTHEPTLRILVIDNGSTDGTAEALTGALQSGTIQKVLLNTHGDVPQWQKSFALTQALKLLSMECPAYVVWLDDDLEITRPFVNAGITLLQELRGENVRVVNMTDNEVEERNHPTEKRVHVIGDGIAEDIKIRRTFNGQFNLFASEFFRELGSPPIAEGINDWGVEDWYYSRLLTARGYRVAVFPAAEHRGLQSKREEMTPGKR